MGTLLTITREKRFSANLFDIFKICSNLRVKNEFFEG